MGNAVIWYQPEGSSIAVKIDLQGKFQERQGPSVAYSGAHGEALGGASTTVIYGGRMSAIFRRTWQRSQPSDGTDPGSLLWRRLWGLQAHLKRGGCCVLAEDEDYAWAAFASRIPSDGADGIPYQHPALTDLIAPSASPADREVYVHTDPDLYLTEQRLCDGVSAIGHRLALDEALAESYGDARWLLVREAGTYPAVRVPESQRGRDLVRTTDNLRFTLELPIEEDPDRLEKLASTGAQLPSDEASAMGQFPDLLDWDGFGEPTKGGYRW